MASDACWKECPQPAHKPRSCGRLTRSAKPEVGVKREVVIAEVEIVEEGCKRIIIHGRTSDDDLGTVENTVGFGCGQQETEAIGEDAHGLSLSDGPVVTLSRIVMDDELA
ncbi:hypothetical protein EVG20_g9736 [Dentipellis fragilis]|uniref:Uncharacterized protein n=1 Tax=Dentipellis fragilis TaxID=205917 RepID=A0A4Y9XYX3_9AGAM|nr:hypothetical protein EVG20_g9736 [Dentipellis fragilis]